MTAWFYPIFFISGAAGLIYQVVWVRSLGDALGSTVVSMSAVFSVFLGGLAVGAWLFGRSNPWGKQALRRYIWLEIAIAFTAVAASLILFSHTTSIAGWSPGPDRLAATVGYALLVSTLLIAPSALLMGGTLPTLLGTLAAKMSPRKAAVYLYGWNTLGAACGALAAGFFLIWAVGLKGAIYSAAILDLLSAAGALALLGRFAAGSERAASVRPVSEKPSSRTRSQQQRDWPVLAFAAGALVLSLEILWGRITRFLLGDRTQAIAALLFVFIAALGAAALLAPHLARALGVRTADQVRLLVGVILMIGAVVQVLMLLPVTGVLAPDADGFLIGLRDGVAGRLALTVLLIGPPILILGLAFPLLLWGASRLDVTPGPQVGRLYLVNTLGAVAGAILATFLLTRWVGTVTGFHLVSLAAAVLGLVLFLRHSHRLNRPQLVIGLAAMLLAAIVSSTAYLLTPANLVLIRADEILVLSNEDEYGVQVLVETTAGTHRVRNNRLSLVYDLGLPQTTQAQQMAAHLTVLLAAESRNVLNIGTGYGITAGAYTLYPEVEYVRSVEILPFLIDLQPWLAPHNFGIASHSRVDLLQGDGRQVLLSSDRQWDIISVNVLDPYLPGSSGLYTLDFWRQARERLNPGGVYTQLFWGADLGMLVRGISQVFPRVYYFPVYGGTSFNVVAFRDEPESFDPVAHFERAGPDARREWIRVAGEEPEAMFPALLGQAEWAGVQLERLAAEYRGPLHTDDRPVLEFRWSHGFDGVSPFDSPLIVF